MCYITDGGRLRSTYDCGMTEASHSDWILTHTSIRVTENGSSGIRVGMMLELGL